MRSFQIGCYRFQAEQLLEGVLVNPSLPEGFDQTPNDERPASQKKWWHRPFIVTYADAVSPYAQCSEAEKQAMRRRWLEAWPSGTRYDVRCLDGGAWDRSTWWGSFPTLEAALACARSPATGCAAHAIRTSVVELADTLKAAGIHNQTHTLSILHHLNEVESLMSGFAKHGHSGDGRDDDAPQPGETQ